MSESINNIGIVASALSDDPRIAARSARAMGFRGVELDVATRSIDLTSLSQTGNRELRHVLASSDQTLIALRADWGANGAGPQADIDRLLSSMQRAMEAAKSLGAPMLCVDVGPLPEPAQAAPKTRAISPESAGAIYIPPPVSAPLPTASDVNPIDPAWMSSVDGALAAIGALSDRIGVIVAIRSELASFAAIERALVAAACIGIGVDFDPVAALRDAWPIDEIFSRLGASIHHMRARDALAGAGGRTRPAVIGHGSTQWPALLGALDAADYRGWLTIDPMEMPDRVAAASAGAKLIRTFAP